MVLVVGGGFPWFLVGVHSFQVVFHGFPWFLVVNLGFWGGFHGFPRFYDIQGSLVSFHVFFPMVFTDY